MTLSRREKVVAVTGASSGIGRAVALQFGARKARVVLLARRRARLEEVAQEIVSPGGEVLILPTDVAEWSQVKSAVQAVEEQWGRIDVLVNNAGYGVYGGVEECSPEDFERQMAVNYLGAVYMTKAVLPLMRRQGTGSIVNVSSISGKATSPFDASYCASKFALNAFTYVLQMELLGTAISVSLVCPGYTKTEWEMSLVRRRPYKVRTPLLPMSAERVAREIVACADRPRCEVLIPRILMLPALAQVITPGLYGWWQSKFRAPKARGPTPD